MLKPVCFKVLSLKASFQNPIPSLAVFLSGLSSFIPGMPATVFRSSSFNSRADATGVFWTGFSVPALVWLNQRRSFSNSLLSNRWDLTLVFFSPVSLSGGPRCYVSQRRQLWLRRFVYPRLSWLNVHKLLRVPLFPAKNASALRSFRHLRWVLPSVVLAASFSKHRCLFEKTQ
jgi:hypothetical protein